MKDELDTLEKAAQIVGYFAEVIQAVTKYERHQQSAELTLHEIKTIIEKENN